MRLKCKFLVFLPIFLLNGCDSNLAVYNVTNRLGIAKYSGVDVSYAYSDNHGQTKGLVSYDKCNGGYYKIGTPYKIGGQMFYPKEYNNYREQGLASWYGEDFHNKKTANGEIFNMNGMTAAHRTLPLPSIVRVTNLENKKSILLRVNDRGPFVDEKSRIMDLSKAAAKELGFSNKGLTNITVELLSPETGEYRKKCGMD
jgi:rare lipoprotein A (peptidoglycan hydrolase)